MGNLRVRWQNAARVLAALLAAGIAVTAGPGLLGPPEPPPVAPDIGLPRGAAVEGASALPDRRAGAAPNGISRAEIAHRGTDAGREQPRRAYPRAQRGARNGKRDRAGPRNPVKRPRRSGKDPTDDDPAPSSPVLPPGSGPAAPTYTAPAPVPPSATPPPAPAPAPVPGDGSEEFAPH